MLQSTLEVFPVPAVLSVSLRSVQSNPYFQFIAPHYRSISRFSDIAHNNDNDMDACPTSGPRDESSSSAQCCHCGYRNSHHQNCPFKG